MSQRSQVSKGTHPQTTCMVPKKQTSQIPRIKSAILHGKAIPIQSYRGLNLVRFEYVDDTHGAIVVIAEEMPSLRRMVNIPSGVGVSPQAGKFFNVICSYKTSSDCISDDSKRSDGNWRASTERNITTTYRKVNTSERACFKHEMAKWRNGYSAVKRAFKIEFYVICSWFLLGVKGS